MDDPIATAPGSDTHTPRGDSCQKGGLVLLPLFGIVSAALLVVNRKQVARYNQGRSNKSLDASGTSGLVIDNLSVT